MRTLTWIGGGNNNASNPLDWSPNDEPQPGDTLLVSRGLLPPPQPFTMNVSGTDLAGNSLSIGPGVDLTANLSHRAVMLANSFIGGAGTFNLSQKSSLTAVFDHSNALTFNLSQNSTLNLSGFLYGATVNISGDDTANLTSFESPAGAIVNLDQGSRWSGTLHFFGGLTVNGGANSVFNNDGNSVIGISATIGVDVTGKGSIDVVAEASRMEFTKSVGPNQSVADEAFVQIDQPNQFAASITLEPGAEIDLIGLANADGYTYKHDMLNILSGSKIIDTLRLHDATPYGFSVEPPTAGSVNIVAITDQMNPPMGLPNHTSV